MYSQWYFEYALLDRVYDGLIAVNPYDLAADIPWAAKDWEVGTWIDPSTGAEKTKVSYWLRENIGGAGPGNGNFTGFYTVKDYEFTCWYNYAFDDDWQWSSFMDINHIIIPADGCNRVDVYFDDVSMWFVYAPVYPLLGPVLPMEDMLCALNTQVFTGADLVEGPPGYYEYEFTPDQVVEVVNATVNGVRMQDGVDFYIRAGYDTFMHNRFVPLRAFAPGDVISITYYYPQPGGAGGTYIGGNLGYDWTDTMFAYGYMYPVSISTTSAALNKNPYFHMETIPKGEIDFRWNYVAGAKPRDGFFKIDILDVVKCTGSYCTRGDGVYNAVYLPGADLDDTDVCHIGILDLVTITGKYANTFGRQPTSVLGAAGGTTSGLTGTVALNITTPISYKYRILPGPVWRTFQNYYYYGPSTTWTIYPWCFSTRDTLFYWTVRGTGTTNIVGNSVVLTRTSGTYEVIIWFHKSDCTWERIHIYFDP
jgi:hypothetical protein